MCALHTLRALAAASHWFMRNPVDTLCNYTAAPGNTPRALSTRCGELDLGRKPKMPGILPPGLDRDRVAKYPSPEIEIDGQKGYRRAHPPQPSVRKQLRLVCPLPGTRSTVARRKLAKRFFVPVDFGVWMYSNVIPGLPISQFGHPLEESLHRTRWV